MIEFRPSHPSEIAALRLLWKEAFGDTDAYLDIFFSTAYAPERSRVICRDGEILGAAYWLNCAFGEQRLAYVYAVAIAERCRGQGLGSMLMEGIHHLLTLQGYAGVLLVPGEESLREYYQRFGYRTASFRRTRDAKTGIQISAERYAQLRRAYLPANGVVQENENLALLKELAFFHEGDGFICAVSRLDGHCLELLESTPLPLAPEQPYAMAKGLTDMPLPEKIYFAFGFD